MGRIIAAGSINMDIVARTQRHPRPGETLTGSDLKYIPGGKGSNQAVAASRLYPDVALIARIGDDAFGRDLQAFMADESLDTTNLRVTEDVASGIAIIVVDDSSENTIVIIPGANARMSASDVQDFDFAPDDVAMSVFEIPQQTIKAFFTTAKAAGARTVLNPAPAVPFIDGLQELVDVLVVNEHELALFAGLDEAPTDHGAIRRAALNLRLRDDQTIVVTLGKEGVYCIHRDDAFHVPGIKVKVVDTTGAGDCFVGALSVALCEQKSVADAVHFANTAASISVQRLGASKSMPYRDEVDAQYR